VHLTLHEARVSGIRFRFFHARELAQQLSIGSERRGLSADQA